MEILSAIRDVAIIVLAIETILVGIGVLVLIWQVWKLIKLVRIYVDRFGGTAREILGTVQQTTETTAKTARHTQATVEFIANRTARPVIEAFSIVSGASRFARAVFRPSRGPRSEGSS